MSRTERDVLRDLNGTYTLAELYAAVEAAGPALTERADGTDVVHGRTDTRWKRRVRNAIQTMKASGRACRVGDSMWVIDGRPEQPHRAVMVSLGGKHGDVELRLQRAADLLADLDEPADLILTDPPYGLGVGRSAREDIGRRVYGRDDSRVVGGYDDVDPAAYRDFTSEWVTAAAGAIRLGGYLAVVTGPQQAAWVQVSAEDAGLTYVNSLAVGKVFPLRTLSRFAHAHWTVTLMCRGALTSTRRAFTPPPDLPKAASGADYPLDLWETGSVGRADAAPGSLRYRNSLPLQLVDRLAGALTRETTDERQDLLVDPFLGGGTAALVALRRGLRFVGGDTNPRALAYASWRLSQPAVPSRPRTRRRAAVPVAQAALFA